MSTHEWSEEYRINLARFDTEHRMLLGLLNELLAVTEIPDFLMYQLIQGKLEDMYVAIRQHFASEERFMVDNGYPSELLEDHRNKHSELLLDLEKFIAGYDKLTCPLTRETVIFLTDWLIRHVIIQDRKMGDYFCNHSGLIYS